MRNGMFRKNEAELWKRKSKEEKPKCFSINRKYLHNEDPYMSEGFAI